jgi:hypothetical protein
VPQTRFHYFFNSSIVQGDILKNLIANFPEALIRSEPKTALSNPDDFAAVLNTINRISKSALYIVKTETGLIFGAYLDRGFSAMKNAKESSNSFLF